MLPFPAHTSYRKKKLVQREKRKLRDRRTGQKGHPMEVTKQMAGHRLAWSRGHASWTDSRVCQMLFSWEGQLSLSEGKTIPKSVNQEPRLVISHDRGNSQQAFHCGGRMSVPNSTSALMGSGWGGRIDSHIHGQQSAALTHGNKNSPWQVSSILSIPGAKDSAQRYLVSWDQHSTWNSSRSQKKYSVLGRGLAREFIKTGSIKGAGSYLLCTAQMSCVPNSNKTHGSMKGSCGL